MSRKKDQEKEAMLEEEITAAPEEIAPEDDPRSAIRAAISERLAAGGIKPDTVATITPALEQVANAAEELRLYMEVFDDAKGIGRGRMEKIKGEVLHTVEDWIKTTGEVIHAYPETIETRDHLQKLTGQTDEEFEAAFHMTKACVDYDSPLTDE